MVQDLSESIGERELSFIVGRELELSILGELLEKAEREEQPMLLHFHGIGGIGKSSILRLCHRFVQQREAAVFSIDGLDVSLTEQGIMEALRKQIEPMDKEANSSVDTSITLDELCARINYTSEQRTVVLIIDTFEVMASLEHWLRERLIPLLPSRLLLLFAGRIPLRGGWILSPTWRERTRQVATQQLGKSACYSYLEMCGIKNDKQMEQIWRRTAGHPLAMSLAAASNPLKGEVKDSRQLDWFGEAVHWWLQEVQDKKIRRYIESAAVLGAFDQERLSFVMEEAVPLELFDQLCLFSFVRRTDRGWRLHDLVRDYVAAVLLEREPSRHRRLLERSAAYCANEICAYSGKREVEHEVGELFRFMGVKVHRALTIEHEDPSYFSEMVTESTLQEAIGYSKWRAENAKAISGVEIDPVTGEEFALEFTAEQVRFNAASIDLDALFRLDPSSIRIIRDREERIQAMAVMIPFHEGTLSWLEHDPLCGPYIKSLSIEERSRLASPRSKPAGWFMRSFDYSDIMNPMLRTASMNMLYSFFCKGGLFVCTTYDNEIVHKLFTGFGFRRVEKAVYVKLDRRHPTLIYELDTRGSGLRHFIRTLFENAGLEWIERNTRTPIASELGMNSELMDLLSRREREVVRQVVIGQSNTEIAQQLMLSESTVKKHLKSIYLKLDVNRRTQLTLKLLKK